MLPRQAAEPEALQAPAKPLTQAPAADERVYVQEDRRLCEILHELGGCKNPGFSWSDVAKTLGGGRTGKSCRLRWCVCAQPGGAQLAGSANCRLASLHQGAIAELRCTPLDPGTTSCPPM